MKNTHLRKMDYKKFQAGLSQTGEGIGEKKNKVGGGRKILGVGLFLQRNSRVIRCEPAIGHYSGVCSHGGYAAIPPSLSFQHYGHLRPCPPVVMLCHRNHRPNLAKCQLFFSYELDFTQVSSLNQWTASLQVF